MSALRAKRVAYLPMKSLPNAYSWVGHMVSKKKIRTKYSSSNWEEQQEWEEYLRRMSASQPVQTEVGSSSETFKRDSLKRKKNKSKKFKREEGRHLSRNAEALWRNDDGSEASVKRQKERKFEKQKRQKQKKKKDKSKLQDRCLHPLPVKLRKDKKSKSLGGLDQSITSLCAETLESQEFMFSEGGRDGYGSFRSQNPVSEGSRNLKQESAQAKNHIHPKSKNGAPYRKSVVFDPLPCSFECVSSQANKRKARTEHMEATEPGPPGTHGNEMLLKSILVSRKAYATFEHEDKVLDPLKENDSKTSPMTAETNSQEFFITQKTFLPAESSSEDSTGAIASFYEPKDGQSSDIYPQLSQELFISKSTTEKATQTDDFFSSPVLSTSFRFHKLCQNRECTEQALDLRMPKRPHGKPTGSTDCEYRQEHETNSDPLYPMLTSMVPNEQNRTIPLSKASNTQLKVVQTRLNESFFFKMKGGGESPMPQSPLLDHGMTKSKMRQMKITNKARRPSDLNS